MKIEALQVGQLGTNCYLVHDGKSKEAMVVDPGAQPEKILEKLGELALTVKYILFTHAHFDHILAYGPVKEAYPEAKLIICHRELTVLQDPQISLLFYAGRVKQTFEPDILVREGDEIRVGEAVLQVLETPGHTQGSMSLYGSGCLLSGDTLFYRSIGRCDFPTGSLKEEVSSIVNKLFLLPGETRVYPGHGQETTIAYEKEHNEVYQWISALN